jgi:hypothetical protein
MKTTGTLFTWCFSKLMSVQTITDTEPGTTHGNTGPLCLVPSDYDIFTTSSHTSSQTSETPAQVLQTAYPNDAHIESDSLTNPPSWPMVHRRVPPYRPINRNLDRSARPAGYNFALFVFINTMLGGCHILAVILQLGYSRLMVGN